MASLPVIYLLPCFTPHLPQRAGTEERKTDGSKGQTLSLQVLSSLAQYSLSGAGSLLLTVLSPSPLIKVP